MEKNTTINKTWYDFYKNKCNDEYYNYICKRYKPFIDEIKKELTGYNTVFEVGCGMGNITKNLRKTHKKHNHYGISDLSIPMLNMASKHINDHAVFERAYDIRRVDPLEIYTSYDLIHSHGVLEHFDDWEIHKILKNQKAISPLLIHYVPSDKYDYKSFGDERLLSKEYWKENFKPTEIIEFNNGYDLILKWRK